MQWADVNLYMDLPFTRNEYYNTDNGVQWQSFMSEEVDSDPYPMSVSSQIGPPIAYQRGRMYDQDWNKGVFGPVFPAPADPVLWVTRTGDKMSYELPWYGDSAGREGASGSDNQHSRLTLFQDDVKLCESLDRSWGQCVVPAADAEYRLELEVDRGAPVSLSTHTTTAWTFRSAHVDGTAPQALPLSAIRFLPALDAYNAAPAGQPYRVPVELEPQPGSTAGTVQALSVDVSYDDGATWTPAVVQHTTNGCVALLQHPASATYVSLRSSATDAAGNTVRQSTIRAYRLAP